MRSAVSSDATALTNASAVRDRPTGEPRDWSAVISTLGVFARRARAEGLRVAYRHHDFEFERADGRRPFDRLVGAADAAGAEHHFVEHDVPPAPGWPSVQASLAHLRTLG